MRAPTQTNTVPGTHPARVLDKDRDIDSQVQTLAGLDLAGLRDRWRRMFGRQAPSGMGRDFMVRAIAYRVQAEALGDLNRKTVRTLKQLAGGNTESIARNRAPGRNLEPGTELIREYQGQQHRVTVAQDGFAWNAASYSTLSGVAKAITGSNWNGYAFFGLTERSHG